MLPAQKGSLLADALAGSWRPEPPPLRLSPDELATLAPLLIEIGGAGLLWWRVRGSNLAASPPAVELQRAYRGCAIQGALDERRIVQMVAYLRSAGVEPLVLKGWAAARLYGEPGLRPYGDLDLCVRPGDEAAAQAALQAPGAPPVQVDLHSDFTPGQRGHALMKEWRVDELFDRSRLVPLGGTEVRILAPEDHLCFLCLHLLGHGAWRPLWLCDVAVALEARPADFDWDRCLGGDPRRAEWVACCLGLAHQLLGARVADTPLARRAQRLPRWLAPTVLQQWGRPPKHRLPMAACFRRPAQVWRELRRHWPNGIEATVNVRGPFNAWPRTPFQLAACVSRTAEFVAELRKR